MATLWKLGKESGLWETYIKTDTQLITKKKLGNNAKNIDYFDAIYFYTTGELDMDEEQKAALISFVKDDGKGFIGGHSAADCFYKWPEYGEMIGAYFDLHPWHKLVKINVEDRTFPATRHLPPSIEVTDEIYQFRNWSRDKVRVLMSIDVSSVDLNAKMVKRTDKDFAMVWVKKFGKGRVFFNALGHEEQVYDRPDMQKLFLESVKWAMGLTDGDTTPRPKAG
jgi:type 1 glutamine amidotransferase